MSGVLGGFVGFWGVLSGFVGFCRVLFFALHFCWLGLGLGECWRGWRGAGERGWKGAGKGLERGWRGAGEGLERGGRRGWRLEGLAGGVGR